MARSVVAVLPVGSGDAHRADPLYRYTDLFVAIRPQGRIDNGKPSFHARLLAARPRQHFLHIGAGTGYYTAILAELVGSAGRVTAFEVDKDLAARARRNLSAWLQESGALA